MNEIKSLYEDFKRVVPKAESGDYEALEKGRAILKQATGIHPVYRFIFMGFVNSLKNESQYVEFSRLPDDVHTFVDGLRSIDIDSFVLSDTHATMFDALALQKSGCEIQGTVYFCRNCYENMDQCFVINVKDAKR